MQLAADNPQPGAAQHINNVAGTARRVTPVVGLDNNERAFVLGGRAHRVLDDIAARSGKVGEYLKVDHGNFDIGRSQYRRLKIADGLGVLLIIHHIGISVADGFAGAGVARRMRRQPAGNLGQLAAGILPAKQQQQAALFLSILVRREILLDILAQQPGGRHRLRRNPQQKMLAVAVGHLFGECQHLRPDELQVRPRHQTGHDPAGTRF